MTGRLALGAVTVLAALLLQTAVVARLPLPGARPDLVLVLVLAVALYEGPLAGMLAGFAAGTLADLLTEHEVGRLALAYLLVGYLVGLLRDEAGRSVLLPVAVVGAGAAAALLVYAAEGLLLHDPRVGLAAVLRALTSAVPYDLALAPLVLLPAARLLRRTPAAGTSVAR